MRFQVKPGYCGPAAIQNALECYGVEVTQAAVAKLAGTTIRSGTSDVGLVRALRGLGYEGVSVEEPDPEHALAMLESVLQQGVAAIILTEHGDHYELAVGMLGKDRFVVFDAQNDRHNRSKNGVHVLDREELLEYWSPYRGKRCFIAVTGQG